MERLGVGGGAQEAMAEVAGRRRPCHGRVGAAERGGVRVAQGERKTTSSVFHA